VKRETFLTFPLHPITDSGNYEIKEIVKTLKIFQKSKNHRNFDRRMSQQTACHEKLKSTININLLSFQQNHHVMHRTILLAFFIIDKSQKD